MDAALGMANTDMMVRIFADDADPRFDPQTKEHIRSLLKADRNAEAVAAWNQRFPARPLAIHQVEISSRNCQHDPVVAPAADTYFVVERGYKEMSTQHDLFTTLDAALAFATSFLAPKKPVNAAVKTRRKARRLVAAGKLADAIDRWNLGDSDPKIAVHQIRVVRANCRNPALGGEAVSRED